MCNISPLLHSITIYTPLLHYITVTHVNVDVKLQIEEQDFLGYLKLQLHHNCIVIISDELLIFIFR